MEVVMEIKNEEQQVNVRSILENFYGANDTLETMRENDTPIED